HTACFARNGTPRNGPSGGGAAASARARSDRSWITALSGGLSFSMRAIASSTSSTGVTSPVRTAAASAVASDQLSVMTIPPPSCGFAVHVPRGSRRPEHEQPVAADARARPLRIRERLQPVDHRLHVLGEAVGVEVDQRAPLAPFQALDQVDRRLVPGAR